MSQNGGWIGIDLDGTLAHYDQWIGVEHIGEPIELMVSRVKKMLEMGQKVKIFTARVSYRGTDGNAEKAEKYIKDWCQYHIGQELEVTNVKDYQMIALYDDRAIQVELNTGRRIDGLN